MLTYAPQEVSEFCLPLARNDGVPLGESELVDFFDDACSTCHGLTGILGLGFAADRFVEIDLHLQCIFWCGSREVAKLAQRWAERLGQREVCVLSYSVNLLTIRTRNG